MLTPAQRVDEPEDEDASADMDIEAPEARQWDVDRFDGIEDAEIVETPSRLQDADAEILKDLPQFIRRGFGDQDTKPRTDRNASEFAGQSGPEPEAGDGLGNDRDAADVDPALSETVAEADDLGAEEDLADFDGLSDDATDEIDLKELEARIAGFETAVAEKDDEWEPDGSSDSDYAAAPQAPLPWQDVEEDDTAEDLSAYAYDPEPEAEPSAPLAQDRLEEASSASVEPDSLDEGSQGPQNVGDDSGWYSDDAVLDEEALRDMVSEIVRQELQGALGERITRNVRKLVRREIHRALMTQGID